jgi:hypothetical protein
MQEEHDVLVMNYKGGDVKTILLLDCNEGGHRTFCAHLH